MYNPYIPYSMRSYQNTPVDFDDSYDNLSPHISSCQASTLLNDTQIDVIVDLEHSEQSLSHHCSHRRGSTSDITDVHYQLTRQGRPPRNSTCLLDPQGVCVCVCVCVLCVTGLLILSMLCSLFVFTSLIVSHE